MAGLVSETIPRPGAGAPAARGANIGDRPLRFARPVLFGSGALLIVFGAMIWTGNGNGLRALHDLLGVVFVIALWRIAAVSSSAGVPRLPVAVGVVWGLTVLALGLFQKELLIGSWHWTIQVLHFVIGVSAMLWARRLMSLVRNENTNG